MRSLTTRGPFDSFSFYKDLTHECEDFFFILNVGGGWPTFWFFKSIETFFKSKADMYVYINQIFFAQ